MNNEPARETIKDILTGLDSRLKELRSELKMVDDLSYEMEKFLENYKVFEPLNLITDVVERGEDEPIH